MWYCCNFLIPTSAQVVVLASRGASIQCFFFSAVSNFLFWHTSINRCDSLQRGLATINVPGIAQKRDFLPAMSVRAHCSACHCSALVPWGRGPTVRSRHGATAAASYGGGRQAGKRLKYVHRVFVCGHPSQLVILQCLGVFSMCTCGWGHVPSLIYPQTELIFKIKRQLWQLCKASLGLC